MAGFSMDLPTSARTDAKPVVKVRTYPNGDQYVSIRWGKLRASMSKDEAKTLTNEVITALTKSE